MTKNKLAKLAAKGQENGTVGGDITQQALPDDFDPFSMLDEHLEKCATAQPLNVTTYGALPEQQAPTLIPTTMPDVVAFNANADPFANLRVSLKAWNTANPRQPPPNTHVQRLTDAIAAVPMVNGQFLDQAAQYELPGVGFYGPAAPRIPVAQPTTVTYREVTMPIDPVFTAGNELSNSDSAPEAPIDPAPVDPRNAGVVRTDRLELDFHNFVDCEAYANDDSSNQVGLVGMGITYDVNEQGAEPEFTLDFNGNENMFDFTSNVEFDSSQFLS